MRCARLLAVVVLAAGMAAFAKPRAAPDSGTPAGKRVMAPWGRFGKRYPGQVIGRYGKFVEVHFDDGYSGWCAGDLVTPPFEPLPKPDDQNPFKEGQKVMAKWSLKGKLRAVVVDTYGDLTLVNFESDDRAWLRSADVRAR